MATSDLLNKLSTDITNTYTSINNLGGTIPEHKNTENIASAIESIYNKLTKVTDTGTDLSLSPTLEARLGLIPRGNTSQDGTPTPTSPIMPKVVTGENSVKIENRNLWNGEYVNAFIGGSSGTQFALDSNTRTAIVKCSPNTTYTIKKHSNTGLGTRFTISEYPSLLTELTEMGSSSRLFNDINKNQATITTSSNGNYLYVYVTNDTNSIPNLQVEKGTIATPYVEHKEQNYPLSLNDIELVEIGDYADYIYGTPDNWVKKEVIGKVVLDGSENWARYATGTADKYRFRVQNEEFVLNDSASNIVPLLCDKFTSVSPVNTYRLINGICRDNQPYLFIYWEDWSEWTVAQLKSELANNNIIVYGPLATPTDVPITDPTLISQLNALYYARSYDDETNISTSCEDGNMPMKINASALKGI